jgi:hypothetical protein
MVTQLPTRPENKTAICDKSYCHWKSQGCIIFKPVYREDEMSSRIDVIAENDLHVRLRVMGPK